MESVFMVVRSNIQYRNVRKIGRKTEEKVEEKRWTAKVEKQ
jgi:hypothetical protein